MGSSLCHKINVVNGFVSLKTLMRLSQLQIYPIVPTNLFVFSDNMNYIFWSNKCGHCIILKTGAIKLIWMDLDVLIHAIFKFYGKSVSLLYLEWINTYLSIYGMLDIMFNHYTKFNLHNNPM